MTGVQTCALPIYQFNASVVGVAPSDRARAYIHQVAAYIAHFHRRNALRWGIDQLALYAVFADLQDLGTAPALGLLGADDIALDHQRRSTFWTAVGAQKFNFLEREARGAAPVETDYAAAFAAYRNQVRTIAATIGWKI